MDMDMDMDMMDMETAEMWRKIVVEADDSPTTSTGNENDRMHGSISNRSNKDKVGGDSIVGKLLDPWCDIPCIDMQYACSMYE